MRVASKSAFDAVKFQLANIAQEMSKANEVVASGKRINELSDDPVGVAQSLNIKSVLSNIEQLESNISLGNSWLTAAEDALTQTQDIISDMQSLCVQMASDTASSEERSSAAQSVQNMLEEIISLANTDVSGRYIFAGTDTDTVPFSQDGTYNGNNDSFSVKIGKDASVAVGSDGQAVFESLLNTMSTLKTALESNDVSGIGDAMDDLDIDFDTISNKISDVGSKMLRMEVKENILSELNISNTERLSTIEDADVAEAVINLQSIEYAYQATLASSSSIMTLSLVDYLD